MFIRPIRAIRPIRLGLLQLVRARRVRLLLERPVAIAAEVIGDTDQRAPDVVGVVLFRELVTEAGRWILGKRAIALGVRRVRRVHVHLDEVRSRRPLGVAVAPVEDEVLARELPYVGVAPPDADALESVKILGATA